MSTLSNGAPMPVVVGHTPLLDGNCTVAASAVVCASGVCGADARCGYTTGGGSCDDLSAPLACRSGLCGITHVCRAPENCYADGDCATGSFCDTNVSTCIPRLPGGTPIPTLTGHRPAVAGDCSATTAAIVCAALVCDAHDDRCGYATGTGPCTTADQGRVCRSSTCSPGGGFCIPSGGCGVDSDCAPTQWCNNKLFSCSDKLPNDASLPTVAGHAPALTGSCTSANGAAVCAAAVCDTADDKCGYRSGGGSCATSNAHIVCRSASCSENGVCREPTQCFVDADCNVNVQYCDNDAGVCVSKRKNGEAMPVVAMHVTTLDGSCTAAAALTVCTSGVCDSKSNACGVPLGDACSNTAQCQAGSCGPAGLCQALCASDGDCGAATYCDADHFCASKGSTGSACSAANACASSACSNDGICVDFVVPTGKARVAGSGLFAASCRGSGDGVAPWWALAIICILLRRRTRFTEA